jgi:hypothetical protein
MERKICFLERLVLVLAENFVLSKYASKERKKNIFGGFKLKNYDDNL